MLITADDVLRNKQKAIVYDAVGKRIPYVLEYDTDTREAVIAVRAADHDGHATFAVAQSGLNGELVTTKIALPGSWIELDGKRL